ncbi:hypothetical protein LP7551_01449 [Roseibium album]|nr:hypothetical protein LP7551_01449 [Roseibium album]
MRPAKVSFAIPKHLDLFGHEQLLMKCMEIHRDQTV